MMEFLCALPVVAGLLGVCNPGPPLAAGYVEGEYVLIAPVETARIAALSVGRGDRVNAGETLATMETRDAEIAKAEARAALKKAQSQVADLRHGKRPEEIAVIEATLNSARAQLADAERAVERQEGLLKKGVSPQSAYEDAVTARDVAEAAVEQARANLEVARLAARPDQIEAAQATVEQARAALENAEWRLEQRTLAAPADGEITDVIRNSGELAGPQAPVLSLLPDGAVKLRFYVPEAALSSIATGMEIAFRCDGCGDGARAIVTYVADDPEFTPPVIYSLENRQKLVWLVEAKPAPNSAMLQPGQIIDAVLPEAREAER